MSKKNIVIAGAGFAGLSALDVFAANKKKLKDTYDILLIDKEKNSEFLPLLPDVVGGWMEPELLQLEVSSYAQKRGSIFINEQILEVDRKNKSIKTPSQQISYDYAVFSSGSETNFYGNTDLEKSCLKLDNVNDAVRIKDEILKRSGMGSFFNIAIAGGGYTGIEIATNINYLLSARGSGYKISIIEKGDDILMMVPDWIRKSVKKELKKLNIDILSGESIKEVNNDRILLASGKNIPNSLCIWSAGVKTPEFINGLEVSDKKTRIAVDQYLRVQDDSDPNIFIAGDNAFFDNKDFPEGLRMAVMFSLLEGKIAATNILNSINARPLKKYKPFDLGYLIPMAHGRAPGKVLGINVDGWIGYFMHYFMCAYRSHPENIPGIVKCFFNK